MSATIPELIGMNVTRQKDLLAEARAVSDKIKAELVLRTEEDLENLDDEKLASLILALQSKKWTMRNLRTEGRRLAALT